MGQRTEKIFERAKVNLQEGNDKKALRLVNQVLNREPAHSGALRHKALIKMTADNFDEAEEFLLFAIKQQPDDDQLYQMLGSLYRQNKKPKKALAQLQKSTETNEGNYLAHKELGLLFAHSFEDHSKAVSHFSEAIALNKNDTDLYFNRGCSYMILQQMEKAEKDLHKAASEGHIQAKEMIEKYFK